MNRVAVIIVTLAVVAGSVPVAGALAGGASGQTSGEEPGAAFAGVVGVQQAEVDNEVAQRSLSQQFESAASNDSKARIVADQSEQLSDRLNELEAEKERLRQARENGSIGQGVYKARLAALGVEIRSVERRANQTADVAEDLPEEALRENGANVSEVRRIAQQANRTGGGEVAEAARSIGGEGVGNGLRGPPNGSETGPPEGAGPSGDGDSSGNDSSTSADLGNGNAPSENVTGQPEGAGPGNDSTAGNAGSPANSPANESDRGQNVTGGNATGPSSDDVPSSDTRNATTPMLNETGQNGTAPAGNESGADGTGPTGTDVPDVGNDRGAGDGPLDGTETESTATATPTA